MALAIVSVSGRRRAKVYENVQASARGGVESICDAEDRFSIQHLEMFLIDEQRDSVVAAKAVVQRHYAETVAA